MLPNPATAGTSGDPSQDAVAVAAQASDRLAAVIDAAGLEALRAGGRLVLVPVSSGETTRPEASAHYIDLAADLTGTRAGPGLYPPPTADQLAGLVTRLGLTPDARIVLASKGHVRDAARAWLVLRWAGFENVAVLDGGVAAASAIVTERAREDVPPAGGAATFGGGNGFPVLDAEGARRFGAQGGLIDARVSDLYLAGHIPGAVNLPAPLLVAEDGKLLSKSALEVLFAAHGLQRGKPVAVYGNGGVGAAVLVLALEAAGYPVSFYWDSWPDWQSDPRRPIARGDKPYGTPFSPSE